MIIPTIKQNNAAAPTLCLRILSIALGGLLLYTATKKLMDLEAFSAHLELLPLVGKSMSSALSSIVMLAEYGLGISILYRARDIRGYQTLLSLLLIYSGYIYYILHWAPFVPCSCQGAFKSISWEMHYLINAVVAALTGLAIWLVRVAKMYNKNIF